MSLLQSLFADKKQSSQLQTAYTLGMQQASQQLWETALSNFIIAVDLAHSYSKAQAMLCLCYAHQVDEESIRIHSRHLRKADAKLYEKIANLPGAQRVLCLDSSQQPCAHHVTKVLLDIRNEHKLPSLLELRLTPSAYIKLISNMVDEDLITSIKSKHIKNPVELPDRCCPELTEKGKAELDIWDSTFSIFAENVMALIEQK